MQRQWLTLLALALIPVLNPPTVSADTLIRRPMGRIYAQNSDRQHVLFEQVWTAETKTVGSTSEMAIRTVYREPGGKEAVIEEVLLVDLKFKRYRQQQLQTEKQALVEREGDKLTFRYGNLKDPIEKLDKSEEDWDERFVVGPVLIGLVQKNWAAITQGEDVKIRFGVADRKETVGFTLTKVTDDPKAKADTIVIRMKPTSFIIASLVKPLKIVMTKDGQQLLEMSGRVIPKIKKGDKWIDLDAETVF